jgi:hypothetical protein
LQLSTDVRARIVAALINRFDGPTDADVEDTGFDESRRRVGEILSGAVTGSASR